MILYDIRYESYDEKVIVGVTDTDTLEIPVSVERIKDSVAVNYGINDQVLLNLRDLLEQIIFSVGCNLVSLGIGTFYSFSKLTSIDLTNSKRLQSIDVGTFAESSLSSITLPEGLQSIGIAAFYLTKLESIEIPSSVKRIDGYFKDALYYAGPFAKCQNLKTVIINSDSQLEYLGPRLIQYTQVEEIFVPHNVSTQWGIFSEAPSLKNIRLHSLNKNYNPYESCLYSYDFTIFYWSPFVYDKQITFHPSTDTIACFAFNSANYSFDIVIPSSVTHIKEYSFYYCKVPKIIFSKSFSCINPSFANAISNIILPNDLTRINANLFYNYHGSSLEIPGNVKEIQAEAFQNCLNLKTLTFYGSKKQCIIIKTGAFKNLPKLDTINADAILLNKISVESNAFHECPLIKAIYYISKLSSIKQNQCESNCGQTCKQVHYSYFNNLMSLHVFVIILL